ncbi:hypothetical protein J3459_011424 [Metarhizium acridum]|uniref:uncharacterized protein n=1 Tax=Metarhizium acridum TaxID=92637 RepID=UPI001C6B2E54|nr:hypothetical protein J3458_009217 [Metarhizium acridum]KAG8420065.1 hypothetical protein J3459_011424 [Metarhizium acridum]
MTIIGCTLWSSKSRDAYDIVQSKINDFKKIDDWNLQKHDEIHQVEAAWLREQIITLLAKEGGQKPREILVATHHAPCVAGTSHPDHSSNTGTVAFATDLITQDGAQDGLDHVKVWAFGHTHYSTDTVRNGIRLVSNQRGYVIPGSTTPRAEHRDAGVGSGSRNFDITMTVPL